MNIQSKTILITGANRGIGRALVTEALRRGAKRVYAGTRSGTLENSDSRITPLILDVTNTAQIEAAAEKVESLDVLINNAGIAKAFFQGVRAQHKRHMPRSERNPLDYWNSTVEFSADTPTTVALESSRAFVR